jgi:hypothetical protein
VTAEPEQPTTPNFTPPFALQSVVTYANGKSGPFIVADFYRAVAHGSVRWIVVGLSGDLHFADKLVAV